MSHPIRCFHNLAECCVFVKQSLNPIYCDPPKWVPLLPKLRGYFAEFLREVSLARLGLLDPPTCVGLRYGHLGKRKGAFLDRLSGDTLRVAPRLSIRLPSHFPLCFTPVLNPSWCRNINLLCIDYALRPHLSSRLTLGGRTLPRKP